MTPIDITMKKAKSTKRFDVFESTATDALITLVYVNKAANAPENIVLTITGA
jgi:hypothetical protein